MATQSRLPAFLLTRPVAQSERFAASLRERFGGGLSITISPLISPAFLTPPFPVGPETALIFTSETGVEGLTRHPIRPDTLPRLAFCVGNRTAKAAAAAGFLPVSADGDAAALIALIQNDKVKGPLLHVCGAQTRGDIAQVLTDQGYQTDVLVVYDQISQPLTAQAQALLAGERPVVVPLFSPRTAALFLDRLSVQPPKARLICATLSDAVAEALMQDHRLILCKAAKPNAEAMIDAIADFFAAPQMP